MSFHEHHVPATARELGRASARASPLRRSSSLGDLLVPVGGAAKRTSALAAKRPLRPSKAVIAAGALITTQACGPEANISQISHHGISDKILSSRHGSRL